MQTAIHKALDQIIDRPLLDAPLLDGKMTDEDLSVLYNLAQALYEAGDYNKAKELFQHLTLNKPFESKHWMGLASVLQMEKSYANAVTAWSMLAVLLGEDPLPHFHAADCLWMLGEREKAMLALDEAERHLDGSTYHQDLKDKIAILKKQWAIS
ncbi:MAG: SycD/LcrH family type III secretion system chaperone [Chlamydiia bacterium]|nr:SycD/LcrH family type III secretion system chaperone [Chlamydiia bacterium]